MPEAADVWRQRTLPSTGSDLENSKRHHDAFAPDGADCGTCRGVLVQSRPRCTQTFHAALLGTHVRSELSDGHLDPGRVRYWQMAREPADWILAEPPRTSSHDRRPRPDRAR